MTNILNFPVKNTNESILVTGGSGYIGGQTCILLGEAGFNVINVDRHESVLIETVQMDFSDDYIWDVIVENNIKTVMHFAADHEVGRSVTDPGEFYKNNVSRSIALLDACVSLGVSNFIFSSSSSVYGDVTEFPTKETTPKNPVSPYGRTKSMFEDILEDCSAAYKINYVALRYFNAVGADPYLQHGYRQSPASHLIPILAKCFVYDLPFVLNGNDYDTPDGTCIRDYTHVNDIASAHISAMTYLNKGGKSAVFNIGKGSGESVLEIIKLFEIYTSKKLNYTIGPRRLGDTAKTYADIGKTMLAFDWKPSYTIEDAIQHAIEWEIHNGI